LFHIFKRHNIVLFFDRILTSDTKILMQCKPLNIKHLRALRQKIAVKNLTNDDFSTREYQCFWPYNDKKHSYYLSARVLQ